MKLFGTNSCSYYSTKEPIWYGKNFELLDLHFEPKLPIESLKQRPFNMWRYREAMPLPENAEIISFSEGGTPLLPIKFKNGYEALIKQEYLFPTGSYKDRGSSLLLSVIKNLGINHIVQDSSGNAGASVAAYAKRAKVNCDIYLPENTSEAKITQMAAYGANIIKVPGTRKETAKVAFEAAKKSYYASHCFNPYFFHGTKTLAYEICEQLSWRAPDSCVLPAGNGTLILGTFIGFNELYKMGIISKIPKLIAIQSSECNPLVQKWQNPSIDITEYEADYTMAEGIAIPNPVRASQILEAVKQSDGSFLEVNETEILNAWKEVAELGFFIEPTSAACIAGLNLYLEGLVKPEICVSLFSGNGLKSVDKISKMI